MITECPYCQSNYEGQSYAHISLLGFLWTRSVIPTGNTHHPNGLTTKGTDVKFHQESHIFPDRKSVLLSAPKKVNN